MWLPAMVMSPSPAPLPLPDRIILVTVLVTRNVTRMARNIHTIGSSEVPVPTVSRTLEASGTEALAASLVTAPPPTSTAWSLESMQGGIRFTGPAPWFIVRYGRSGGAAGGAGLFNHVWVSERRRD